MKQAIAGPAFVYKTLQTLFVTPVTASFIGILQISSSQRNMSCCRELRPAAGTAGADNNRSNELTAAVTGRRENEPFKYQGVENKMTLIIVYKRSSQRWRRANVGSRLGTSDFFGLAFSLARKITLSLWKKKTQCSRKSTEL